MAKSKAILVTIEAMQVPPRVVPKTALVQCRVSPEEKAQMLEVAAALGVDVSEYLRQLHRQAWAGWKRRGK